jgi:hypothetical protein
MRCQQRERNLTYSNLWSTMRGIPDLRKSLVDTLLTPDQMPPTRNAPAGGPIRESFSLNRCSN